MEDFEDLLNASTDTSEWAMPVMIIRLNQKVSIRCKGKERKSFLWNALFSGMPR